MSLYCRQQQLARTRTVLEALAAAAERSIARRRRYLAAKGRYQFTPRQIEIAIRALDNIERSNAA